MVSCVPVYGAPLCSTVMLDRGKELCALSSIASPSYIRGKSKIKGPEDMAV